MKKLFKVLFVSSFIIAITIIISGCTYTSELYKVTFDLDGGTTTEEVEYICQKGSTINLFTPEKEDATFDGWFLEDKVIKDTLIEVNSDLSFKAKWVQKVYHINLDLNGGTSDIEKVEIVNDGEIKLPTPVKVGHKFLGWYLNDELFTNQVFEWHNDLTLVAKWEAWSYVISLMNGDSLESKIDIKYGEEFSLPVLEKEGYNFLGWYLDDKLMENGAYYYESNIVLNAKFEKITYTITLVDDVTTTLKVCYNELINLPMLEKVGFEFLGWFDGEIKFNDESWHLNHDITLTSKWEKIPYEITLEDNNSTTMIIYYGDSINLPIPTKSGFSFLGWYLDGELFEETIWERTESIVLKASWEEVSSMDLINQFSILYYNMQNSAYDQISLYKNNVTISASKYWHKIAIKKVDDNYYVSGIANSGESLASLGSYDYIMLAYSSYNRYSDFTSMDLTIGDLVKFESDLEKLENGSINVNVSFYHEHKVLPPLDIIYDYFNERYYDITEVDGDIDLLTNYENYQVKWVTSNCDVISSSGEYKKPSTTRTVVLKAMIEEQEVYQFSFVVRGNMENSAALATGYFYTNFTQITENTIKNLDIMYCSFGYINASAEFTNTSDSSTFIKNIKNYVLPLAKKHGTKVLISVNENDDAFGKVAMNEVLSKKLANNIVELINRIGLDGIDIDWEYPTVEETPYFTTMMKDIYEAVKKNNPNHLVTAAIGGGKWQPPRYDLSNSYQYLDYINLMTYSMSSGNGQFQNALYRSTKGYTLLSCSIDESIAIYDGYGVPRNKILIGLAFYGIRQFDSNGPGTSSSKSSSISYKLIYENYILKNDPNILICYDEESESPYIYDKTNKVFISYENERSIKRKCEYVNTLGLAGVMYWQDGHDYQDILLNAVCENIRK